MKLLITAGATREPIDEVRFISNASTGATGAGLADEFVAAGHSVVMMRGRGSVCPRARCEEIFFSSTRDLHHKLSARLKAGGIDAVVMAAAVSDYCPESFEKGKMDSSQKVRIVRLVRTPKLLPQIKSWSARPLKVVGFKLTVTASRPEVKAAVKAQFEAGGVDVVVHNDMSEIQDGRHPFKVFAKETADPLVIEGVRELAGVLLPLLSRDNP